MATMKAVRIHSFGGPEVLVYEDVRRPEPRADELLVRVHAASVNPVDWKIREGKVPWISEDMLPITLGRDISGVVETGAVEAANGATGFGPGEAVYAMLGTDRGGYAEYAIVKADEAALKPRSLDHVHAAAVPLAGLTAWQGLFDHGRLKAGQRVLIHGAAGGVGHFAVQFTKAIGAFAYGTASGDHVVRVRELGADEVIDYKVQRFEDVAKDVDLVLDLIGGETQERSWAVVKAGGIIVSAVTTPSQEKAASHRARGTIFRTQPSGQQLAEIGALTDAGKVKPFVQAVFPLSEAAKALQTNRQGHTLGKIVLRVAD